MSFNTPHAAEISALTELLSVLLQFGVERRQRIFWIIISGSQRIISIFHASHTQITFPKRPSTSRRLRSLCEIL